VAVAVPRAVEPTFQVSARTLLLTYSRPPEKSPRKALVKPEVSSKSHYRFHLGPPFATNSRQINTLSP
jgi:hypothetical protein